MLEISKKKKDGTIWTWYSNIGYQRGLKAKKNPRREFQTQT